MQSFCKRENNMKLNVKNTFTLLLLKWKRKRKLPKDYGEIDEKLLKDQLIFF